MTRTEPVRPNQPRRFGLALAAGVATVALIVVVVVGSGLWPPTNTGPGGGGPVATPTPATTPTPVPTPSPDLTPAKVTGTETCTTVASGTETKGVDVTSYRGVVLTCTDTSSDPRVTGTSTVTVSIDERPDESADIRGTFVLKNDGGTWEGRWSGTVDKGYTTHHIESVTRGTGAYTGLEYRQSVTGVGPYTLTGAIARLDSLPTITGSEACSQTADGTTTKGVGVTSYRGVILECTETSSDPRVAGTSTITVSIDERTDGSADIWGTFVLKNDGGRWEGRWSGTVDKGYTTHHTEGLFTGTGAYAGLEYRVNVTGEDGRNFTLTGTIAPTD